ncbi:MAG: DUF4388 domain-containing protein [Syntrophobacteraceae bacterium]
MAQVQQVGEKFSGEIDRVQLIDLVQSACLSGMDRAIRVESASGAGEIRIRSGQAVYAKVGEASGEAALKEMFTWAEGRFRSYPESSETVESIRKPWEQLLIDAVQYRAEKGFATSSGPESEFSGRLAGIGLADLMQLACMMPVERVLRIEAGRTIGTVCFRGGRIVHSQCGGLSGEHAFWELMLADEGGFESTAPDGSEPATIAQSLEHLFAGAMGYRKVASGKPVLGDEEASLGQKIQRMRIAERIRAAMTGNQETRTILMRDNNRMVQLAVVSNPRLNEGEVALIAGNRQADEEVLRRIAANREWMRLHHVRVALVKNPKCPLPIAARLIPTLGPHDWKSLSTSKSVPAAVSQMAKRLVKN